MAQIHRTGFRPAQAEELPGEDHPRSCGICRQPSGHAVVGQCGDGLSADGWLAGVRRAKLPPWPRTTRFSPGFATALGSRGVRASRRKRPGHSPHRGLGWRCRYHTARKSSVSSCWTDRTHAMELDWEAFDLLRAAGRQAASYLAEERSTKGLRDSELLTEYSKRFAFVVHDIKNLASQLGLMVTNAHRYIDNPEFQRDMLSTVEDSVSRMNKLLSQLKADRCNGSANDRSDGHRRHGGARIRCRRRRPTAIARAAA